MDTLLKSLINDFQMTTVELAAKSFGVEGTKKINIFDLIRNKDAAEKALVDYVESIGKEG